MSKANPVPLPVPLPVPNGLDALNALLKEETRVENSVDGILRIARALLVGRPIVLDTQMGIQLKGREAIIQAIWWTDNALHAFLKVQRTDGTGFLEIYNQRKLRTPVPVRGLTFKINGLTS